MALSKIDTAAIATDAIEAAQLKSDAIGLGDFPVGSIVKVDMIQCRAPGTQTVNNTTTFATDFNVDYTVVSGGNKVVVLMNYSHFGDVDSDSHDSTTAQIRMQYSTDGGTTYTNSFTSGSSLLDRGGQTRHRTCDFMREIDLPASVTNNTLKIRMQGRRVGGSRSYNMGGENGSHVTFIEIQK